MAYRYNYEWHPLYKLVMKVKSDYFTNLVQLYKNNTINNHYYNEAFNIYNFKYWLEFLENVVYDKDNITGKSDYSLSKIFDALIINQYGNLVLFKYKRISDLYENGYKEDFFEIYNCLFRECRSVVIDIKNDCIALTAMSKFKNYGEDLNDWSETSIQNKIINSKKVEITNKMDGSFQQYRYYSINGNNTIIGSGSQALDQNESWRLKKGFDLLVNSENNQGPMEYLSMLKDYRDYTFMFEFISPDNQIVVQYDKSQEGLYLFSARNNETGKEMNFKQLSELANKYNINIVEYYNNYTLNDILGKVKNYSCNEKEGWVVKIYDQNNNYFRVKVKIDDYVLMHRALSKLVSPNSIIQAYENGKIDDFYSKIPLGYKDSADKICANIVKYINLMNQEVKHWYEVTENTAKYVLGENNLKNFMIATDKYVPKKFRSYVKNIYLNKENNYLKRKSLGYIKYNTILEILEEEKENLKWKHLN